MVVLQIGISIQRFVLENTKTELVLFKLARSGRNSESKVNSPCPAPSIHSFEIRNIILFESLSEKEGET